MFSPYWDVFFQRLIVVILLVGLYIPGMLKLVKFLDSRDGRYDVSKVASEPSANAIYGGIVHGALILALTLLICDVLKILFL